MAALASSASTKGLENTDVCNELSPMAGFGNLGLAFSDMGL